MSDEYFTLVFKGSLASFAGNPLTTKTPFGVPVVAGVGNAFAVLDMLELIDKTAKTDHEDDDDFIEGVMK